MIQTVYYLVHKDTLERQRYYKTIAGARIAQRQRNHRLGFNTRIERTSDNGMEFELCTTLEQDSILATYAIVEDTIESNDGVIDEST